MKLAITLTLILVGLLLGCHCSLNHQENIRELDSQLYKIDTAIKLISKNIAQPYTEKKYSLKFDSDPEVEILDSLKIPSRKDNSYPLLLRVDRAYYNIAGEEMFKIASKDFMLSSSRNDFSHFAERSLSSNRQWTISQLEVLGRYCSLKPIATLTEKDGEQTTTFMSLMFKGKRVFLLGSSKGNIIVYDKQGAYERTMEVGTTPIIQMIKTSANLFIRSSEGISWIGLTHDRPLTKCELPDEQVLQIIVSNDHGSNKFYARTESHVFVYEVGTSCKPKRVLDIPRNSSIHILADSLLASNNLSAILFNSTVGYRASWMDLRKPTLQGNQYNLSIFKKSEGVFGLFYSHYNETTNQTELSLYQYQLDDDVTGEGFSLKGFKAPIFIISIGVVFYYSFLMKKNKTSAEELNDSNELEKTQSTELPSKQQQAPTDPIRTETKQYLPKLGNNLSQQEFNRIVMDKYLLAREIDKKSK